MSSLKRELVERFQAIYYIKYGTAISYSEAESKLKELADIVRLTSKARKSVSNA